MRSCSTTNIAVSSLTSWLMQTNDTLMIKNCDPVGHNSKLEPVKILPSTRSLPPANRSTYTLPAEEVLPVKVALQHPSVDGWLDCRSRRSLCRRQRQGWTFHDRRPAGRQGARVPALAGKGGFPKTVEVDGVKVDGKGRFKLKLAPAKTKN